MGDTLKEIDKELKIKPEGFIPDVVDSRDVDKETLPLPERLQQNNTLTQLAVITLSKAGMSPSMIANQTGLQRQSIEVILNNERLQFLHNGRADIYRKALPMLLLELATSSITSIDPEALKKINTLQRVTLSAIAIDKARLLLGESTENISVREYVPQLMDEVELLMKQKAQILDLVKTRYGVEVIPQANVIENQSLPQE